MMNGHSAIFKRPIFILGAPRSGITMVAGLVKEFGVWTGAAAQVGPAKPKGFVENTGIRDKLIKPILTQLDCDPLGVKKLPAPRRHVKLRFPTKEGEGIGLKEKLHRIVEAQGYDHAQRWMYKDAKLTLLWRSFAAEFPDAEWVIVRRERHSVVKSCLSTPFMSAHSSDPKFWEDFADQYNKRLDMLQAKAANVHEVDAEQIFNGDVTQLKSVSDAIGLQFNLEAIRTGGDRKHWHHS